MTQNLLQRNFIREDGGGVQEPEQAWQKSFIHSVRDRFLYITNSLSIISPLYRLIPHTSEQTLSIRDQGIPEGTCVADTNPSQCILDVYQRLLCKNLPRILFSRKLPSQACQNEHRCPNLQLYTFRPLVSLRVTQSCRHTWCRLVST